LVWLMLPGNINVVNHEGKCRLSWGIWLYLLRIGKHLSTLDNGVPFSGVNLRMATLTATYFVFYRETITRNHQSWINSRACELWSPLFP
jgi:hypothetical protein